MSVAASWWTGDGCQMRQSTDRPDRAAWTPVSRRQALLGIGTLAAGGGAGVAVLSNASDPAAARATVQVADFAVADAQFTAETVDPEVVATIEYEYDAGNAAVKELRFALDVDGTEVASDTLVTDATTHTGETDLSGRLLASDAWSAADFEPEVASSVSQDVTVTVRFDVLGSDGDSIVGDEATDAAVVTVSHPQESEYIATVGGTGEIVTASE